MPEIQLELEKPAKRFELMCAITIAIFAAVLAMTDLGSSKYGDDEIMGTNEKSNVYAWYQSKSIKQSLEEGQRDLLKTLLESGSIMEDKVPALQSLVSKLDEDITRYKQEKKELLVGSAAAGRENSGPGNQRRTGQGGGRKGMGEETRCAGPGRRHIRRGGAFPADLSGLGGCFPGASGRKAAMDFLWGHVPSGAISGWFAPFRHSCWSCRPDECNSVAWMSRREAIGARAPGVHAFFALTEAFDRFCLSKNSITKVICAFIAL